MHLGPDLGAERGEVNQRTALTGWVLCRVPPRCGGAPRRRTGWPVGRSPAGRSRTPAREASRRPGCARGGVPRVMVTSMGSAQWPQRERATASRPSAAGIPMASKAHQVQKSTPSMVSWWAAGITLSPPMATTRWCWSRFALPDATSSHRASWTAEEDNPVSAASLDCGTGAPKRSRAKAALRTVAASPAARESRPLLGSRGAGETRSLTRTVWRNGEGRVDNRFRWSG